MDVSEGGQGNEEGGGGGVVPPLGQRLDRFVWIFFFFLFPLLKESKRLSELAFTIQNELKRIKSEGASGDDVDDAEGVGGTPQQQQQQQHHHHHQPNNNNNEAAHGTDGALLSISSGASSNSTSNTAPIPLHSPRGNNLVWLNVGGQKFCTTLTTLTKFPHSMLGAMFSGRFNLTTDDKQRYFIDRDGKHFGTILNFLRDGSVVVPGDAGARAELLVEAQYYQLSQLIELLTPEERLQTSRWRWSPGSKSAYITLVNDYRTARAGEGKNWNTVLGDTGFNSGRHYFEITITKYNNSGGGWGISFGLVDVLHDFEYNHFGHRDNLPKGTHRTWAYVAATGKIYERGVEMYAGRPYSVNDRVGLLLDWKCGVLRFYHNGEPEGPGLPFSWSAEDGHLFPSMSLNGGGDKFHVTILDNPKLPEGLRK